MPKKKSLKLTKKFTTQDALVLVCSGFSTPEEEYLRQRACAFLKKKGDFLKKDYFAPQKQAKKDRVLTAKEKELYFTEPNNLIITEDMASYLFPISKWLRAP